MTEKQFSKKSEAAAKSERQFMIGPQLTFAASESYKLLRTNIMFSFVDRESDIGKVIGVTSSVPSEGKSLSSINLAYTFAESNKRVILIEGDMRNPTLAKRLKLTANPGLSELLIGLNSVYDAVQTFTSVKDEKTKISFDVISAGTIPPNPSELLGSNRFNMLLSILRENYDYIIIDQPPVTVVTDALITSPYTDGTIIVVRDNKTDRGELAETIRQLEFVDAHILGFVYNGAGSETGKYYRKGYYKKDYKYKYYSKHSS